MIFVIRLETLDGIVKSGVKNIFIVLGLKKKDLFDRIGSFDVLEEMRDLSDLERSSKASIISEYQYSSF